MGGKVGEVGVVEVLLGCRMRWPNDPSNNFSSWYLFFSPLFSGGSISNEAICSSGKSDRYHQIEVVCSTVDIIDITFDNDT